jgi:hypothetical protein
MGMDYNVELVRVVDPRRRMPAVFLRLPIELLVPREELSMVINSNNNKLREQILSLSMRLLKR